MKKKPRWSKASQKRWAKRLTVGVLLLQGAMLLTLFVTQGGEPIRLRLFELLWASARKPSFYPLVALLIFGPILTALALWIKGKHRWVLGITWPAFLLITWWGFGDRIELMMRVLHWSVTH